MFTSSNVSYDRRAYLHAVRTVQGGEKCVIMRMFITCTCVQLVQPSQSQVKSSLPPAGIKSWDPAFNTRLRGAGVDYVCGVSA